ncbi:MAG: DEAD/DEAH box helicase, partial [Thermoplasmatota archaeon]
MTRLGAFDLLSRPLREALERSGITEPTEPQEVGIPAVASGESVLLIAPTGLGKTEAVVLPLLDRVLSKRPDPPSLIYITPLRALNRDLLRRLNQWAGELGVRVGVRHGDTPRREREEQLRRPPDVLITTPETLQIMLGSAGLRRLLRNVRWVVIDEIHELAGDERGWQLAVGLERLGRLCGRELQRVGVSATIGNAEEVAEFLAGVGRRARVLRVPVGKDVSISVECPRVSEEDRAEAERLRCDGRTVASMRRCSELFGGPGGTLLFTNTRDSAEVLASRFRIWRPELRVGVHHGSLHKDVRVWMEEEFKAGRLAALICTSSLELGIDIGGVQLTLQHGSPRQATRLVQRVGRSGHRRGLVSRGVVLAQDADDAAEAAVLARRAMAEEIEPVRMRRSPLGVLANQLIAFAVERGTVDADEVFETVRRAHPFRELDRGTFDDVLGQLVSLGILWSEGGRANGGASPGGKGREGSGEEGAREDGSVRRVQGESPRRYGRRRGAIRFFYENISMIPDERSYRVIDVTTRASIGTLDDFFVTTYGEVGARFIVRGASWRIVELREDSILVEPSPELGAVPGWIGEEIPVPLDAAQEVGRLRAAVAAALRSAPAASGGGERGAPEAPDHGMGAT